MPMSALATHGRIFILAVAALALGTWHLVGLRQEQHAVGRWSEASGDPLPVPELVVRGETVPGAQVATPRQDGWGMTSAAASSGAPAWNMPGGSVVQDPVQVGQAGDGRLLDDVFAPDRFAQAPAPAIDGSTLAADDFAAGGAKSVSAGFAAPGGPGGNAAEPTKLRQANEKTYYEEYVALGKEDASALGRQAAIVLVPDGETARQVALLRALYDQDRSLALDHFSRAISILPDVSKASGVSVPFFAARFLARQVGDPAAVGLAERIAWNGHLNVSQDVRNAAASVLLSRATPDDLQRYATYPGFKPPMPEAPEP